MQDLSDYKKKYLKYKEKYLQLKSQIGVVRNTLPGSLFQLLKLFVYRLPYEVSIQVNSEQDGTISLFLTKGFESLTDYEHESHTLCGIHIHTHPYIIKTPEQLHKEKEQGKYVLVRRESSGDSVPSGQDIKMSIGNIGKSIAYIGNEYKYDYMFDGINFWYFKANQSLIAEFKKLLDYKKKYAEIINSMEKKFDKNEYNKLISYKSMLEDTINKLSEEYNHRISRKLNVNDILDQLKKFKSEKKYILGMLHKLTGGKDVYKKYIDVWNKYSDNENRINELFDIANHNTNNYGLQFLKFREPYLNYDEYINLMKELLNDEFGMDIGTIDWESKKSVEIPDNLDCKIFERRDRHIILPNKDYLEESELELLFDKAKKILESRSFTKVQESPI